MSDSFARDAFTREPFEELRTQHEAVSLGIWVFLASETLLFSALFGGYSVYRLLYGQAFLAAAGETNIVFGTVNTAVLMTSSLTIAIAGRVARAQLFTLAYRLLIVTFCLGTAFLVIKGFEYREDLVKHLVPGAAAWAAPGAQQFFVFYWIMTGIHAVHVTAGLAAVARLIIAARKLKAWLAGSASEEATALYWHLVDAIWIVLYPLLYLAGRAHG